MKLEYLAGFLIGVNKPVALTSAQREYLEARADYTAADETALMHYRVSGNSLDDQVNEILERQKNVDINVLKTSTMTYEQLVAMLVSYSAEIDFLKKANASSEAGDKPSLNATESNVIEQPFAKEALADFWDIIGPLSSYSKTKIEEAIANNSNRLNLARNYYEFFKWLTIIHAELAKSVTLHNKWYDPSYELREHVRLLEKYRGITTIERQKLAKFASLSTDNAIAEEKLRKIFNIYDVDVCTLNRRTVQAVGHRLGITSIEKLLDEYVDRYDFTKTRGFGPNSQENLDKFFEFWLGEMLISELRTKKLDIDNKGEFSYI